MGLAERKGSMAEEQDTGWLPEIHKGGKPVYLAIADAIADDIRSGRLTLDERLPPQRVLADRLGLDFTTVSRAYAEARRRGLVVGRVGQGTFVRGQPQAAAPRPDRAPGAVIDMTMNAPPLPDDPPLIERMRRDMAEMAMQIDLRRLLGYRDYAGSAEDRAAGALWLRPLLPDLAIDRLLVSPGAQGATLAVFSMLARPGDVVCCEALTYPGVKAMAAQLGIRLVGLPMDRDGIDPDAFRAACLAHAPKALYCNPTLHNPTTLTVPLARREALVAVAREFGVAIVEDDAYGLLPRQGPPPLAALAPELTYYVSGLAKCVAPALRIAYLVAPDSRQAARVASVQRATMLMASPISAALITRWIDNGTAQELLNAIRIEAINRQKLAGQILPPGSFDAQPEGSHLWLHLPEAWPRGEFIAHLRGRGLAVAGSDAFAVTLPPPEALRLCLGTLGDLAETRQALSIVADLLDQSPAIASAIV